MSNILVIAPHPDDETLGCGGTLFRRKEEGDVLHWLTVTGISEDLGWSKATVKTRKAEIKTIENKYGFKNSFHLSLPAKKIDTLPISELIEKIKNIYKKIEPEIIFIPFIYDIHTDHQIVGKAIQSTLKWFRSPYVKKVLMYETPSETDFNFLEKKNFRPNVFINISKYLDHKVKAMKIYKTETGKFPFPRSEKNIRSLAAYRGSQSGFKAAEAFELVYERK